MNLLDTGHSSSLARGQSSSTPVETMYPQTSGDSTLTTSGLQYSNKLETSMRPILPFPGSWTASFR